MMKGLKKWRLFAMLTALIVFLSGCGKDYLSTLSPAGEVAKDQHNLMLLSTAIMTLVILVVVVIYVLALIRFRRKKVGENVIPKQVEGSTTLEVIWTAIPIILLLILAVPTVALTYKLADTKAMDAKDAAGHAKAVTVNVTAKLYWWQFEYPNEGIVTSQELVVPTGEKVYFNLTSGDVKHSFWVPSIGGKMDTNVDNVNKFYLEFDKQSKDLETGVFYGKCAELCGPSHALMDFKVKSLSRADFDNWVKEMKASDKQVATGDLEKQGEALFKTSCITCHATSGVGKGTGIAPNLATFGDRNRVAGVLDHNTENIKKWIDDPQSVKPGNTMPQPEKINKGKKFTDQELDALAAYLMGLSVEK
ncbi:cytochrome c oxidase subunit II [Rummeliibacillus sp. NPDC094406]|uniref:cytochrome c oxidase subunit II n=1 Tax=Rummeliibacillus sp. NPDC094406 TaxID=3364511 RepID=UPI003812E437